MTTPTMGEEPPDNPVLRLRITHITSSMSAPLPALHSSYLAPHLSTAIPAGILPHHMPVFRIFGTTPSLQKICANIHLCYPYFYVPYPMDSSDPLRPDRVIKLCQRFAVSLNHAICLAMRQNPTSTGNKYGGGTDPKHLHVVSVQLVKGVPFYGYHIGYSYFLKVSLVSPQRIYVALEQLRKPAVLGREWQPHEAHMNHVLQFMCDFDLYGCGWLNLAGGTFREPLPEGDPFDSPPPLGPPRIFNSLTVPSSMVYPPGVSPSKDTFATLEIDILPNQILNRRRLKPRDLHHDFIELLRQPLDPKEKLVPAVAELWEDERRRRSAKGLSLAEHAMLPGQGMGGRSMEELGYRVPGKEYPEAKGGNWKISDEYWEMIQERMRTERNRRGKMSFERFSNDAVKGKNGEKRVYDRWVPTAFEAVASHWPVLPGDPKSIQRSRRSRYKPSSNVAPSSPVPHLASSPAQLAASSTHLASSPFSKAPNTSPVKAEIPTGPDLPDIDPIEVPLIDEDNYDSEEDNPFHAYAMTQAVTDSDIKPDINANLIARTAGDENAQYGEDAEEAEYEAQERRHAEDARMRAEAGIRARASQMPRGDDGTGREEGDEFDDDELDELFRRTVMPGSTSAMNTPKKARTNGVYTPTTRSGGSRTSVDTPSTGGRDVDMDERRAQRELRMRQEAGWGDLSTILDQSSMNGSSPHGSNPYHASAGRTPANRPGATPGGGPLQTKTPSSAGEKTPTNRNPFAKPRHSSPLATPTKRGVWPPTNTVILPPSRRSAARFSPERDADTPTNGQKRAGAVKKEEVNQVSSNVTDVKPVIGSLQAIAAEPTEADVLALFAPAQQTGAPSETTDSAKTASNDAPPLLAPTIIEPDNVVSSQFSPTQVVPDLPGNNETELNDGSSRSQTNGSDSQVKMPLSQERPKKRVRMAGPIDEPENPFTQPVASQQSQASQQSRRSQFSMASSQSNRLSVHTDTSSIPSVPTVLSDGMQNLVSNSAWTYHRPPPSAQSLQETLDTEGIDTVEYQDPYYSNPVDVPLRAKMFAGRMFTLKGSAVKDLQEFEHAIPPGLTASQTAWLHKTNVHPPIVRSKLGWEFARPPPRLNEVMRWCDEEDAKALAEETKQLHLTSQLAQPTQKSKFGFKFSQKKKSADSEREAQNMSVLSLEVFATSRHQLLPDPEKDELVGVFFCYQNDDDTLPDTTRHPGYYAGYCVIDSQQTRDGRAGLSGVPVTVVDSELDLINWVIDLVKGWDPDVLAGWELHNASWGYLTARANDQFSMDLTEEISRVVGGRTGPRKDFYSATHSSTFKVSGRHILNVWRICRSEINLTQYSFENVVFHLLHQRIPHYPAPTLTALWRSKTPEHTTRVLKYYFQRVVMYCEVIDAAEIITKNAEFARVFGVDFASVMFRGSQYKVESFMFRIAKPESFILVSPSKQQVGLQNAPFAVPLIAEPESKYYNHPIIVLDFQSLYPSVMIAYNICFSTCLGRVEKFKGTDKFGFTELKPAEGLLEVLKDYLTVTPNGMIFVKPAVRKSLLSKMLAEILDTRVMIKHAMKGARGNKSLLSLLNARQLGLKLMANVTYGYTSATYSGRMPCIEVADSIVQTGRETLERAQELIHSRPDWDAQVVYGDTDSLFVALPGRSKDQAFKIGNDIADTVTAMNPKPVKLKFEKVYMGSVLMAKKRYVGFKYEHPDETEPVFDAKGIETIRRDGFPAQQKIEEVCLKLLFRTQDLSQIKEFCRAEWTKILQGRVSVQDFIVAKEVRLGSYSEKGVPPPGAAVAYRRILKDPRDEPQYAERVPYIVSNAEGRRLIDRARMPEEMLSNRSLGIDAEYYIRNLLIPPLSRIFNLVGADVEHWYDSMPRTKRAGRYDTASSSGGQAFSFSLQGQVRPKAKGRAAGKMRIDSHFKSSHCIVCGAESVTTICAPCRSTPAKTTHTLLSREHIAQSRLMDLHKLCASCSSTPVGEKILCDSIDCPITYARTRAQRDVEDIEAVRGAMRDLDLDGMGDGAREEMVGLQW